MNPRAGFRRNPPVTRGTPHKPQSGTSPSLPRSPANALPRPSAGHWARGPRPRSHPRSRVPPAGRDPRTGRTSLTPARTIPGATQTDGPRPPSAGAGLPASPVRARRPAIPASFLASSEWLVTATPPLAAEAVLTGYCCRRPLAPPAYPAGEGTGRDLRSAATSAWRRHSATSRRPPLFPYVCWNRTTRVAGPIADSTAAGSRFKVSGETSAYTGFNFSDNNVNGTTLQVSGESTTSSPGLNSMAERIARKPVLACPNAIACATPIWPANCLSYAVLAFKMSH